MPALVPVFVRAAPPDPVARIARAARCHAPTSLLALALPCLLAGLALSGCATRPPAAAPPVDMPVAPALPPAVTRGEFTLPADKLDTWNAVGQIVVRTDGAAYEGRSQMLDLYSVRYRGEPFLLLTRALVLSDTIKVTTTRVTAATLAGKPIDSPASAELLALLQRELPAEIERVRAQQTAEKQAQMRKAKAKAAKAKKRRK